MLTFWQDLRFGFRMLRKYPAVTVVAVLSLALGIGANTCIFTLVNAVLLRPLPVADPEGLVAVYSTHEDSGNPRNFSYPEYLAYRDRNDVLDALVGHSGTPLAFSLGEGQPETVFGEMVTANFFTGLKVPMLLGRPFLPEEAVVPGSGPLVVLSHAFWERQFGSDPHVLERVVRLNGHEFTVVGVAGRGFSGTKFLGFLPDLWVPATMAAQIRPDNPGMLERRGSRFLNVRARLKPGVTQSQAEAALNIIAKQLAEEHPDFHSGFSVHVIPGSTKTEPQLVRMGFIPIVSGLMMAIAGLVLLIACANVANLLLARSSARRREIAVRLAVGAGRFRLIRQLLTEGLLLSILGGGLGLLTAFWFRDLVELGAPVMEFPAIDFDQDMALDHRVLGFTFAVAILTTLIFGLLPALQASRSDLVHSLKGDSGSAQPGKRRWNARKFLVSSQVALSLMLLIGAGLFLVSARNAGNVDPGFETRALLLASVNLDLHGYDRQRGEAFFQRLLEEVRSIAGVEAASAAFPLPLDTVDSSTRVYPEGYVPRSPNERNSVGYSMVGAGYFETIGTALTNGKPFDAHHTRDVRGVVIINESMARRFWPERDPIGQRIRFSPDGDYVEVVGVARDGKYVTLGEPPTNYMFFPFSQNYSGSRTLIVRTQGDPGQVAAAVRRAVQALDPQVPVYGVKTMDQFMGRALTGPYSLAGLIIVFGLIALTQASIGIFGVMNHSVESRTQEMGIRMALGAHPGKVIALILRQGMTLVFWGVLAGIAGAVLLSRFVSSLLFGVHAIDAVTYAVLTAALASVALVSCLIPAWRAARVDLTKALRYE